MTRSLNDFEPLVRVHSAWQTIAEECALLDTKNMLPFNRRKLSHVEVAEGIEAHGAPGWLEAWGPTADKWLNYVFIVHDHCILGDAGTPRTMAILRHLRGIKAAALSLFRPGAYLPVHEHPELAEESLLTMHLGLKMAPDYSYLFSEGEFIREEPGKGFVFDGSKPHFAFNFSDQDRLILYIEFEPGRLRWVDD